MKTSWMMTTSYDTYFSYQGYYYGAGSLSCHSSEHICRKLI